MHTETPNLHFTPPRRTYMAHIEDIFKKNYGPHSAEHIQEATGFSRDIVRTSLHAFKRYGVMVLLKSVAGTNLWLYNPRGDKRRVFREFRVSENRRERREKIHYVEEA